MLLFSRNDQSTEIAIAQINTASARILLLIKTVIFQEHIFFLFERSFHVFLYHVLPSVANFSSAHIKGKAMTLEERVIDV